jgi:hypothetical protein
MKRPQVVFLIVFLVGASLLVLALQPAQVFPRLGYTTHRWAWGSPSTGDTGWLMPADTQVSTSYSINQTVSSFIEGQIIVFTYQVQSGTVLDLGLYLNDNLASVQNYTMKIDYDNPAQVLGVVENGVANFSNSRFIFTVSELNLRTSIPAGTKLTITAWVSKPVWVQIDTPPLTNSYESSTSATFTPPSVIVPETGEIAQHTLSVGGGGL